MPSECDSWCCRCAAVERARCSGNGLQDASEAGIPNVVLSIAPQANVNQILLTTATNANGLYLFSSVNPLTHALQLTAGTAYQVQIALNQDPLTGVSVV
jgi:hypothetical protein